MLRDINGRSIIVIIIQVDFRCGRAYSDNDSDRLQENSDVGRTDKCEDAANGWM